MSRQDDEDQPNQFRRQSERDDAFGGEPHVPQLDDAPLQRPHRAGERVRIRGSIPSPEDWPRGHPRPPWYPPEPPVESRSKRKSDPEPVGYGRPPREHRFKPGQSGNPKGRRLGSKNKLPAGWGERMRGIVREEAYREIAVREGDAPVTIPMAQAVMRSVAVNAAKGQHRAQRLFFEMVTNMEAEELREHREYVMLGLEYKFNAEQEIARRKQQGITDVSDILPHPDDIIIDVQDETIRVEGPMTAEQRDAWTRLVDHRETLQCLLHDQQEKLKRQRKPESRALTEQVIALFEQRLEELNASLPNWVIRD